MSIEMTASLFRSYANEEKPVRRRVSRRKDEEGCGTSDVDTEVNVQRGFVVSFKLCRTRGSRSSPRRALSYFKDTARRILSVELCERDSENIGGR